MARVVVLDGSLGGANGNTAVVLEALLAQLQARSQTEVISLAADVRTWTEMTRTLDTADGFVFATGTYWDSWGSPLQRFLEQATDLEATSVWLGKPAAVLVTMHSVGGKGVLSRLQGVLSTLGLLLPPMSGLVYSLACQMALNGDSAQADMADFWGLPDCEVIAHNLLEAINGGRAWRAWPVDRARINRRWARNGT